MVALKLQAKKMPVKRIFCVIFSCIFISCYLECNANAVWSGIENEVKVENFLERASGKFTTEIPSETLYTARTKFPLEVGETVTIKATYSPFSASVDFGLIAPDGDFYFINTNDGSFDKTIEVNQRGNYTLAIRNNSKDVISVSGYVMY